MKSTVFVVIYFAIFFNYSVVAGQEFNMNIDTQQDTTRISLLLAKAKVLRSTLPDSAIVLSRKALYVSRKLNSNLYIAKSLLSLGSILFDQKQYLQSKIAFEEAYSYCKIAQKEDNTLLARLYNNLANVFVKRGLKDSALAYYFLSLKEINERHVKDSNLVMLVMANAGATLAFSGQNKQALFYLNKSLNIAQQLKDTLLLAQNYLSMGHIYQSEKANDSTIHYYYQALNLYKQIKKNLEIPYVYYKIGIAYGLRGDLERTKKYFDSALHIGNQQSSNYVGLQVGIGDFYMATGKYRESISPLNKALDMARKQGVLGDYISIYRLLSRSYFYLGNIDSAFKYQKAYSELQDSFFNVAKIETINSLEIQYRTSEKDKELAEQKLLLIQKENKLKTKDLWIGIISGGFLLLTLFFLYAYRSRQKLNKEKAEKAERLLEIDRLRAVMEAEEQERNRIARDLHDGVGVLVTAAMLNYSLMGKQNAIPLTESLTYKDGIALLQEMRQEIRAVAHNLMPGTLAQQSLASALQTLVNRMQQNNMLPISLHTYGIAVLLEPARSLSLYRMIEELIQNALKHAGATETCIELLYHEEQLNIIVKDDGKGFDTTVSYEGIGLKNLFSRAKKIHALLSILSEKGKGTTVELEVPYIKKDEQTGIFAG